MNGTLRGAGEQPYQRGTKTLPAHPPHLQNFSSLSCDYFAVNQSRLLVCDLGNPMKAGASVSLGQERGPKGAVASPLRAVLWDREGGLGLG